MKSRTKIVLEATERIFADQSFSTNRREILAQMPDYDQYLQAKEAVLQDSRRIASSELMPCWTEPLLTREQEFHVARQYNFLKSCARNAALIGKVKRAENYLAQAHRVRELFALANMRLVPGIIKKVFTNYREDLIAEAYAIIYKVTEYFDWRRSLKFSTYATWAVSRNLYRINSVMQRFEDFEYSDFLKTEGHDVSESQEAQHKDHAEAVHLILDQLEDPRERDIIKLRFGIGCEPLVLKDIGEKFGISKERIRQLETRTLNRLHIIATRDLGLKPDCV